MSHPKLTKIDSFLTEFEAKAACNLLLDRGIPAYIEGAAGQTVLSYLGPAMSGVRLLVEQEHEMLAKQILAESTVANSSGGPWTCGTCFSEVDDGFEVCWKCGSLRAESEWVGGDDDEGELDPKQLSYAGQQPESGTNVDGGNNPYKVPSSKLGSHVEEVSDLQMQQEAILDRAWGFGSSLRPHPGI